MRRNFIPLALACALIAGSARAQSSGVALRWNHCFGEGTGLRSRSFACDSNAGLEELVGSFVLWTDLAGVIGNQIVLDFSTTPPFLFVPPPPGPPLPEWWKFRAAGTCRQNALSASFLPDPDNLTCRDWGGGQQVGAIASYQIETLGQGRARLLMGVAVPVGFEAALTAGIEYASFTVRIRHDKTVGTGACAGCQLPMFIAINRIDVVTPDPLSTIRLGGPVNGTDADRVSWNADVTASRSRTWAALKSIFR